ncbi:ATP-dependent protease ClpP protease subunit [Bradyrhizobium japonicum]
MKFLTALLAAAFSLGYAGPSDAVVRITNDRGGLIQRYFDRYENLKNTGQTVIIDGLCASACTIVLAKIPSERICVTERANLAFHAAWDLGAGRAMADFG